MEKLLTPLAITVLIAVLGGHIYNRFFYAGKRRRAAGQHRYSEADCVNTFWATITQSNGESYEVPMWGYRPLELGVI